MTAEDWIERLGLVPHPEGGHYRETWRHEPTHGERGAGTSIYFLLRRGESSHWHRVDAAEIWHFYAGAPLELRTCVEGEDVRTELLGAAPGAGEMPQRIVPPHAWQAARSLGEFTLVGCTVSPAFEFSRFELAPPGFEPNQK